MGYLRFRRSIRIAPGIHLNLGKPGISTSVGVRGMHETFHISGRRRTSIGIPGTGISYISQTGRPSRPRSSGARRSPFSNGPGFQVQTARRKMVRPTGGDDATQALVPVTGLDPYTVARYDGAGGPNALHRPKI